jgi:LysM repeat protein
VASSAPKVAVVARPADAPSTEPIRKPEPRPASITVGARETLADVAKQWNTSVPALMMENNLVSDRVKPGTRIKLPPPIKK